MRAIGLVALLCATLGACVSQGPSGISTFEEEGIFAHMGAKQPKRVAAPTARGLVPIDGGVGETLSFTAEGGDGPRGTGAAANSAGVGGGSYTLNFENAPLADVVRAIMTDALGLNYATTAQLAGTVTISSARPVRRDELLDILENLLAGEGFALTGSGDQYLIEQSVNAVGGSDGGPGFGVTVVPLRYTSLETMNTIVTGFVAPGENVRISTARNAIIIRGSADRRREAAAAIVSFDADWMKGQAVQIFELRRAQPDAVVTELEQMFAAGEGGGAVGTIEFKAIPRLRAVMAVSKSPTLVRRAAAAVRELDVANAAAEENVFVYRARYRNAAELTRIVGNLFNATGEGAQGPAIGAEAPGSTTGGNATEESDGLTAVAEGSGSGSSSTGGSSTGAASDDRFANAASLFPEAEAERAQTVDLRSTPGNGVRNVRISADIANNAVVTYADGETYEKILATLKALDVTPVQVAINVIIAEVRLTDQLEFGVQYFVQSKSIGLGRDKGSASLFTEVANTIQKQLPGFNFVIGANANPDVIISALDAITDVEVLSSPSLVVVENETATLQVGDSVPVTVRQAQSIDDVDAPLVNQVEFRDTGIILSVTPRIGENDAVTMKVSQEISAVVGEPDQSLTPTISRRRVNSAISVQNGQTVLLAGLISASRNTSNSGIPGLKDVPVAGKLFGTDRKSRARTELVVLIRPVVIRSGEDASSVAQDFRARLNVIGNRTTSGTVVKP